MLVIPHELTASWGNRLQTRKPFQHPSNVLETATAGSSMTLKQVLAHLRHDNYQGARKLKISPDLLKRAKFLVGDKTRWTKG